MAGTKHHVRAQELSAEAAALVRDGHRKKALEIFAEAAKLEEMALEIVPQDRVRTRGILAVSVASLLYKAKKLREAQRFLFAVLASEKSVLAAQEAQLRELLEVVWDELSLPVGSEYAPNQIDVALRGGSVGFGTAPLGLALAKADEIMKLVVRFGEFLGKKPLRTRGAASPDLLELVQARVTQPVAGSYRFSIKLVEPAQHEMFDDDNRAIATSITPLFFDVMRASTSTNPAEKAKLKTLVPDDGYRQTMVKLVRNMVPADDSLREIELSSVHRSEGEEPVRDSVLLSKEVKASLNAVLREEQPKPEGKESAETTTLTGVLRAVHLNDRWLVLVDEHGVEQRCETGENALDDLIGPMVNRRVEVRGRWETRKVRRAFRMIDIEPLG